MAVIQAFDNVKEATRELVRSKDDVLVYHTGSKFKLSQLFGFRGQYDNVVEEIGIFAELDDYVHSFYGVGGCLHNFFSKKVDGLNLGSVNFTNVKLDFGVIDPHGNINGLLGLDILMKLMLS